MVLVISPDHGVGLRTRGLLMFIRTLLPVVLLLFLRSASSITYYVSETGNDSWSGTSPDSSFATLQHSADITVPGDSVLTFDGSYAGFDLREGGFETDPIVFSTVGDAAIIDQENPVTQDGINIEGADWVVIDGFNLMGLARNGIRVVISDHVSVRNCYCGNCYERAIFTGFADWVSIEQNECFGSVDEHGIYHSNSGDHPVIRNNICHHNNGCGIHMNGDLSSGGDGIISDATVEGNVVYENGQGGGSGINCDGVVNSRIFNNLLYMNHSSGISLYRIDGATGSHHMEVYNNTIVQPNDGRWGININTESTDATLLNNIILSDHSWRGSVSIDASSLTGFESDFNLIEDRLSVDGGGTVITLAQWQVLGYGGSSAVCISWNDTFEDWPSGDFHCRDGSQPVDAGTFQVQAVVIDDLDGVARPQGPGYDIGCYERYPQGISQGGEEADIIVSIASGPGCAMFQGLPPGSSVGVFEITGRRVTSLRESDGAASWEFGLNPAGVYLFAVQSPAGRIIQSGKIAAICCDISR